MKRGIALALSAMFLFAGESLAVEKRTIDLPVIGLPATPGQQLQDVVNDPANVDVRVRLAPGTYQLDPSRPNGGRLVLQPGMEISGANRYIDCDHDGVWDPIDACAGGAFDPESFTAGDSATLIDGTLIVAALPAPVGSAAVVRVGRENALSRLTIRAPRRNTVAGSVDVNLTSTTAGANAVLRDNVLEGGQRGVRANNGAPAVSGITSTAILEGNIIRNMHPAPNGLFGFGIQIQNSGASDSVWEVTLRNNRIYANRFGVFIVGNNSRRMNTRILSIGNIVHHNQLGIWLTAGFSPAGAGAGDFSSDNEIRFDSNTDRIEDNVTPAELLTAFMEKGGGLVVLGAGRDSATAGACSGNRVRLQLLNTTFRGNRRVNDARDMTVIGSLSSAVAGPETGTGNVVDLLMRRTNSEGLAGAFLLDDSEPDDVTGTNQVTQVGSEVAFEHANSAVESAQLKTVVH
jgi:hypothetical protein